MTDNNPEATLELLSFLQSMTAKHSSLDMITASIVGVTMMAKAIYGLTDTQTMALNRNVTDVVLANLKVANDLKESLK